MRHFKAKLILEEVGDEPVSFDLDISIETSKTEETEVCGECGRLEEPETVYHATICRKDIPYSVSAYASKEQAIRKMIFTELAYLVAGEFPEEKSA